jgi:outer membrane immunogenic protein
MKRIVFGAVFLSALLLAAPMRTAGAADLAIKGPPPVVPWVCTFCGWYAGLNAGYVITSGNGVTVSGINDPAGVGFGALLAGGALPFEANANFSGFIGGAQAGYNWEYARGFLLGVEGDFDGIAAKRTIAQPGLVPTGVAPFTGPSSSSFEREADWVSTLRARFGVQVLNGSFMPYVTAGGAAAEVKMSSAFICTACAPATPAAGVTAASTITRFGGAVGAGFEWMIVPKFTIKGEYMYVEVGNSTNTLTYNGTTVTYSGRNGLNMLRAGINWYF